MKAPPRRPEAPPEARAPGARAPDVPAAPRAPEPGGAARPDPRAAALRASLRRMAERPETAEALARALRSWLRGG